MCLKLSTLLQYSDRKKVICVSKRSHDEFEMPSVGGFVIRNQEWLSAMQRVFSKRLQSQEDALGF